MPVSWDVFIMRFPKGLQSSDEIPVDWNPEELGTVAAVRAAIEAALPDTTWDSTGWGRGTGNGFSVEVFLSGDDDDLINGFTLGFRGGGEAAQLAMALAEKFSARALGSGKFLTPDTAGEALREWHRYRDQTIGRHTE
jgi:hypothetical protein